MTTPPSGLIGVPLGRPKLPLSPSLNISKKRTTLNFYRSSCARQVLMLVDSIELDPSDYRQPLVLKEKDGERYLLIWVGPAEVDAIAVKLQDVKVLRPLTHDLLRAVIETLGGSVEQILVSDLQNGTFYAQIYIRITGDDIGHVIDCRASDAIALAIRVEVPIYVDEAVLNEAGVLLDEETGKFVADEAQGANEPKSEAKPPTEEELKGMSAFQQFIEEGLDLDDLGKEKKDESSGPG